MADLQGRQLRMKAKEALSAAKFPPTKFVFFYALALVVPTLIFDCLFYWLGNPVEVLSGSADTAHPALFSAVVTAFILYEFFVLFWQYSHVVFSLRVSRGKEYHLDTLWDGFRLWKRAFGATFWIFLRTLGLFFMFTAILVLCINLFPVFSIAAEIGFCVVLIQFIFTIWAVPFMAVDKQNIPTSALYAVSRLIMQNRKWQVFKVEFQFFWHYLLITLVTALPSVWLSVNAAVSQETVSFTSLPFPIYLSINLFQNATLFLFYLWKYNEIQVTRAMAYNAILTDAMPEDNESSNFFLEN